jgi:uncharacterized membrane protein YkoI
MKRNLALIAAAVLAVAAPSAADAQLRLPVGEIVVAQLRQGGASGQPAARTQVIGTQRAVAIARGRAGGGQVLDAGLSGSNYRVRIRTSDGRVIDFIIDAESGSILSMDGG